MEENSKWNMIVKRSIFAFIIILIAAVIGLIILKYSVEGEQNMPFNLSEVLVISTAEGYQEKQTDENKWNVDILQTNDVYLNILKNKNYKDKEIIREIKISNINIEEDPKVGKISIYIPDENNQTYNYEARCKVNSEIIYSGDIKSDIKNLKISNQGGTIIFRIVNETGKQYISNEDELKHDGTLLKKVGISTDDITSKISFDVTICLESDISFTAKISLKLPVGDITTQGVSSIEKKDIEDIVFKRETN